MLLFKLPITGGRGKLRGWYTLISKISQKLKMEGKGGDLYCWTLWCKDLFLFLKRSYTYPLATYSFMTWNLKLPNTKVAFTSKLYIPSKCCHHKHPHKLLNAGYLPFLYIRGINTLISNQCFETTENFCMYLC